MSRLVMKVKVTRIDIGQGYSTSGLVIGCLVLQMKISTAFITHDQGCSKAVWPDVLRPKVKSWSFLSLFFRANEASVTRFFGAISHPTLQKWPKRWRACWRFGWLL